jgi:hypothetical protein
VTPSQNIETLKNYRDPDDFLKIRFILYIKKYKFGNSIG